MKLILALTISDVHGFVLCGASKKRECEISCKLVICSVSIMRR